MICIRSHAWRKSKSRMMMLLLLLLVLLLLSTWKGRRMQGRSPVHYGMLLKGSIHVHHSRWWPWRPWKLMSRRPRPELRSIIPSWPKHFESNFLCNDNCPNTVIFRVSKSAHSPPMHLPCLDNQSHNILFAATVKYLPKATIQFQ